MKRNLSTFATMLLAALLALPGLAMAAPALQAANSASSQDNKVGSLTVNNGVVMLSQGGSPFASARTDEAVFSGQRLMVSEQSSATIVYNDGCRQTYDKPGVYDIGTHCVAAILPASAGNPPIGVFYAAAAVTGGIVARALTKDAKRIPPVSR